MTENLQLEEVHLHFILGNMDFHFSLNDGSKLISFIVDSNMVCEHTKSEVAIANMIVSSAKGPCKDLNGTSFCSLVSRNASSKKRI